MIALRATREAVKVAHEVAFPQIPQPRRMSGAEMTRLLALGPVWKWGQRITHERLLVPAWQLAPGWMKWFAAGCVLVIAAATIVIFKIAR
jgi:hypothetical protein